MYMYTYMMYIYMFMVMIYRSFSRANVHYRVHNNYSYWKVCLYIVQYTNSYRKIDRYDRYISIYMLYICYIYIISQITSDMVYTTSGAWMWTRSAPEQWQTFFVLSVIISATECLTGDFHKSEVLLIASALHVVKAEKIYRNTTKIKQSETIKQVLETVLITKKDGHWAHRRW